MKRVFIAIDISEEARKRVSAYVENLKGAFPKLRVGWERPEKLHFTVKFLGNVTDEQLVSVNKAIGEIAAGLAPFKLKVAGTGVFPSLKKPRVLWIGISGANDSLKQIFLSTGMACEEIGFAKEARSFSPHLTIARLREPASSIELAKTHLAFSFEPLEFEVPELVVYESHLSPKGSVYLAHTKAALGDRSG